MGDGGDAGKGEEHDTSICSTCELLSEVQRSEATLFFGGVGWKWGWAADWNTLVYTVPSFMVTSVCWHRSSQPERATLQPRGP